MRLLNKFRSLFEHTKYVHRNSNLGNQVALEFFEDLVDLGKSSKLVSRVLAHDRVVNLKNTTTGKSARRGNGTFGELVPTAIPVVQKSSLIARGPTANVEMGGGDKNCFKGDD